MSYSQILEVAIGLVLVYYVMGSIVSWITKIVTELQETRGKVLEDYLKKIAGDKTVDLTNLPQMKALQPIRFKSPLSVFTAETVTKKIEKVPVATLVDAFFDLTGLTGRPQVDASGLKNTINALPDSEGKRAMLKWVDQGVTSIDTLRGRANTYFAGILDQAAAEFKAHARSSVIILSLLITLLLGTDSIQLAKDLWTNAELRAVTAAQADMLVQQGQTTLDLNTIIKELNTLSIVKFGWWQLQGVLPENATAMDWVSFILLKILGLGLTVVAVSQGSSFWYDVLRKVSSPPKEGGSSSSSSSGGEEEAKG